MARNDRPRGGRVGHAMLEAAAASRQTLEPAARRAIVGYLCGQRAEGGGFRGRDGRPDLYYTFFGLAGLMALGAQEEVGSSRPFLDRDCRLQELDLVHAVCLARCRTLIRSAAGMVLLPGLLRDLVLRVATGLSGRDAVPTGLPQAAPAFQSQRPRQDRQADIYTCFLAWQAAEESNQPLPAQQEIRQLLDRCRCADGSFATRPGFSAGNTPATAAAVVLAGQAEIGQERNVLAWLLRRRERATGGFRATCNAPEADLLSTATALFALRHAGVSLPGTWRRAGEDFVAVHWNEDGGFCGSVGDRQSDPEYTFYGLLALGCLAAGRG